MTGQELLDSLGKLFGQKLQNKTDFRSETTYTILPADLREVAKFSRHDLSFDYLIDITSIDNFGEDPRFEIVYELYSMTLAVHLRLKLKISEDEQVDTISDLWPTANWHEREIYDMMGIKFKGHPDLRRILMWDGYPFFPLRKEFPLEGLPSEMPDVALLKLHPSKAAPSSLVPAPPLPKIANPGQDRRNCEILLMRRFHLRVSVGFLAATICRLAIAQHSIAHFVSRDRRLRDF